MLLDCFSFNVLATGEYAASIIMLLHQMPLLHSLEETISPSTKLTRQDTLNFVNITTRLSE
jgi:hypothetical protein